MTSQTRFRRGETAAASHSPGQTARELTLAVVAATVLVCVLLVALALPGVRSGLHEIPIGLAGAEVAVEPVERTLAQTTPAALDVSRYETARELEDAIEDRDVYGGIVVAEGSSSMLVASGGSAVIAQALHEIAQSPLLRSGKSTPVVDVAPLPDDDPRGAGIAGLGLPLSVGAALAALLLYRRLPAQNSARVAGAALFAVAAGFSLAAILDFWFGSVEEHYPLVAAGLSLGVAAVTFAVLGLATLLGMPGFGIGIAFMALVANPLSGLATAPEFLPAGWGAFGQWLPTGAAGTLLRSNAFFDGAAAARPALILAAWVLLGLALCLLPALRRRHADY